MKFAADMDCATEGLEEKIDQYDESVAKDERIQAVIRRMLDMVGGIRDALIRSEANEVEIELLDDLEDEIVNLQTEMIDLLASKAYDEIFLAYQLGLIHGRLRERRNRQSKRNGGRHE